MVICVLYRYVIASIVCGGKCFTIWCPMLLFPGAFFLVFLSVVFTSSVVIGVVRMCVLSRVLVSMVFSGVVWSCILCISCVIVFMWLRMCWCWFGGWGWKIVCQCCFSVSDTSWGSLIFLPLTSR